MTKLAWSVSPPDKVRDLYDDFGDYDRKYSKILFCKNFDNILQKITFCNPGATIQKI